MQNGGVDPTRVTRGHAAAMANPAAQSTTSQPYTLPTLPGMEAVVNGTQGDGERLKSRKELEMEKKDLELGELLEMMDEWRPIIPDEVTDYYLQRSGFETSDLRVKRLLALATQRFVSSIATDAFAYARTRTATGSAGRGTKDGPAARAKDKTRTVLTMEDLSAALQEYGVNTQRAPFFL